MLDQRLGEMQLAGKEKESKGSLSRKEKESKGLLPGRKVNMKAALSKFMQFGSLLMDEGGRVWREFRKVEDRLATDLSGISNPERSPPI